ncbi:HAMP domain-containing histidine kinase [Sphingomonas sp. 36D10-4-7]|uniref:histidine kinase n=1 Tax=Sphingomonas corticis TaxID=2722791 RepID=A0ABX1CN37_9SPHN|nr:HAMP domain-containing histidine kinase [Sphingomonas corticis]NJR79386.1 HAMP domain-containing histidine kinase [Sphingomonas corticis]
MKTVLAADTSTAFGARAAYRQLVDLIARGRASLDDTLRERLAALRPTMPAEQRAALARGLALADPPVTLIAFLADDTPEVTAAVLRAARLSPEDWDWLLPRLGPHGRSVLRRRGDLPPTAVRALESFGSTDFALSHEARESVAAAPPEKVAAPKAATDAFRALGDIAATLPPVAAARDHGPHERFEIAELVDRIAAYQRQRATGPLAADTAVTAFRFETDAAGVIRWIDSAPRGAVIGLSLDHAADAAPSVDGVAAGAFRKRAAFGDARLSVRGESALSGDWRISAVPLFDPARGAFIGYRGSARRPRLEEDAARLRPRGAAVEGLRRLVHELRTPTTAIAGFAELIDEQLLGPVPSIYRDRAATIRRHVGGLVGAIDDLDTAARLEADALDLRDDVVGAAPLLERIAAEMAPLAARRGARLSVAADEGAAWAADAPALERLISRLLASLLSTAAAGEVVRTQAVAGDPAGMIRLTIDRPLALASRSEAELLAMDDERAGDVEGAPLLGIGFSLRLARHLAVELGGGLAFERDRLTLTLPAASTTIMGQASTSTP